MNYINRSHRSSPNLRILTVEEIAIVSAGLANNQTDGIRDVATGASIVGGALIGIAAAPIEAPVAIVAGGAVIAGAAGGALIGLGINELSPPPSSTVTQAVPPADGGLVVDVTGGQMPSSAQCAANPGVSDYCPSSAAGDGGSGGTFAHDGDSYEDGGFADN